MWLVRRLDISVDLDAGWGREQLAAAWAAQVARSLVRELRADGDGSNSIRFPNRAAYLASFLADLSRSSAWDKWYYAGFEGLRVLSQSAALRTAACERPEEGRAALAGMPRRTLEQFVPRLLRHRREMREVRRGTSRSAGPRPAKGKSTRRCASACARAPTCVRPRVRR